MLFKSRQCHVLEPLRDQIGDVTWCRPIALMEKLSEVFWERYFPLMKSNVGHDFELLASETEEINVCCLKDGGTEGGKERWRDSGLVCFGTWLRGHDN